MRIVAGILKGRRLIAGTGDIRPTPERLRESLFSSLGESVAGSVWVDLFAGSGAIGLEALSRGARFVLFNDRNPDGIGTVRKNLKALGLSEGFALSQMDALVCLRNPPRPVKADFVYLDPPYAFERYRKLLEKTVGSPIYEREGTSILLETFKKTSLGFIPSCLEVSKVIRAGDSQILFLTPHPLAIQSAA